MSIYTVHVDGQIFYHPAISALALSAAVLKEDAASIDTLALSAPHDHPYLAAIHPLKSVVEVRRDDRTIFAGRAVDDGCDLYDTHTWSCEGALAFLKDTWQEPFDYQGALQPLLQQFLDAHNDKVEERKRFKLGNVTVQDDNDYVHYQSEEIVQTLTAIKEKLIDTHGGYLQVRYEEDGTYLDYLADFTEASVQKVEYGTNVLDVKIEQDHSARYTALIPYGAITKKSDSVGTADTRLDITSVNGGKNYVYDETAAADVGWLWTTEVWDDVTTADALLRKARQRLAQLKDGIVSMELTIVDETDTIHARQYVDCSLPSHGIEGRWLVLSRSRDILRPANDRISIGAKGITLSRAFSSIPKQGPQGKPGADGEDGVVIKIASSKGLFFKNTAVQTVLAATVFYGKNQIGTLETLKTYFGQDAHLQWQIQAGSSAIELVPSTDGRIGQDGFAFTLSPADIDERATITCSLSTDKEET